MVKYLSGSKGDEAIVAKQEHQTCLHGTLLGDKDDARICLRGLLDGLHAKAVLCAVTAREQGDDRLQKQIEDIAVTALALLQAEYNGKMPALPQLGGQSEAEIHHASHFPKEAYGVDHFFPTAALGRMIAELNALRCEIRTCERQAVAVYKDGFPAFIQALNRLSSYAYCLMCQQKAKQEGRA